MAIHPPPPPSSSIPVVNCTTLDPPSPLFIYYPNSQMYDTSYTITLFIYSRTRQMYDTSSTILPLYLLSQYSNVRHFIHHPPCSSTIPIVKCTTLHPPSPCSSTIPIVKCTTLHPPSPCSSTIPIVNCTTFHPPSPLFIYYPNSQTYDTSFSIPPLHLLSQ